MSSLRKFIALEACCPYHVCLFSHNITVVGLLNSLVQALCPHCWISSFQLPSGKRQIIVAGFLVGPLWLDPSGFLVGPLRFCFLMAKFRSPRLFLLKGNVCSLTRFLHDDIFWFLVGPVAFAFQRQFSPSLTPPRGSMTFFLFCLLPIESD